MVESGLDLAKELPVSAATPERSPVRPTLRVSEIEQKFGIDAIGFIGKEIKESGLKIDGVPQQEAIKRQMAILIAADQKNKKDFVDKGAGYEVEGGNYSYAFLPIKDIEEYKEGETPLIEGSYELEDAFKTLEAIIEQGENPEADQNLNLENAQKYLDVLTTHTEATVVFGEDEQRVEEKITYEQWKSGKLEDGTVIPDDAEVSFQLVGKAEEAASTEETVEVGGGEVDNEFLREIADNLKGLNSTIEKSIQTLAKHERLAPQEQSQLKALLVAHFMNPHENEAGQESRALLEFARDYKKFVIGGKEAFSIKPAELFMQAVREIKTELGQNFDQREIIKAIGGVGADTALNVLTAEEGLDKLPDTPEFNKLKQVFDEEFRKEFCRRLFGHEEVTRKMLQKKLVEIGGKDVWKKVEKGIMNALWIFMLYGGFKQVIESMDPTAPQQGGGS